MCDENYVLSSLYEHRTETQTSLVGCSVLRDKTARAGVPDGFIEEKDVFIVVPDLNEVGKDK